MGDPKKARKKYTTPSHPWQKTRIDAERVIRKKYGVTTKKEIWKMDSLRKRFTSGAKALIAKRTEQAEKERIQLVQKLQRMGFLDLNSGFDDILGITLEDIMDRRLQTKVWKMGFAKTTKQARQFITHGHVIVSGKKITMPSYIVSKQEETLIQFLPKSALADPEHPERIEKKAEVKAEAKTEAKADTKPESKPATAKKEAKKEEKPKQDKKDAKAEAKDSTTKGKQEEQPAESKGDDKK